MGTWVIGAEKLNGTWSKSRSVDIGGHMEDIQLLCLWNLQQLWARPPFLHWNRRDRRHGNSNVTHHLSGEGGRAVAGSALLLPLATPFSHPVCSLGFASHGLLRPGRKFFTLFVIGWWGGCFSPTLHCSSVLSVYGSGRVVIRPLTLQDGRVVWKRRSRHGKHHRARPCFKARAPSESAWGFVA